MSVPTSRKQYLPDRLAGQRYYDPSDHGYEKVITERMDARRQAREAAADGGVSAARSNGTAKKSECDEGVRAT